MIRVFFFSVFRHRTIDPTKIIVTGKRVRFSFVGISDIIYFDPNQANPAAAIANYQQVKKRYQVLYKSQFANGKQFFFYRITGRLNVIR